MLLMKYNSYYVCRLNYISPDIFPSLIYNSLQSSFQSVRFEFIYSPPIYYFLSCYKYEKNKNNN